MIFFASDADKQEILYMTEDNSAWKYNWQKLSQEAGVLWANPPFEDVYKMVTKAILAPLQMVLVVPDWRKGQWKQILPNVTSEKLTSLHTRRFLKNAQAKEFCLENIGVYNLCT